MAEARVVKFCVDCRLYHVLTLGQLTAVEGALAGSCDHVYNFTPHEISSEWLKLQTSSYVWVLATRCTNLQMTNCPLSGQGQGHVTHSWISHPLKYLWNG